jgi:hypothetical protein
MNEAQIIGMLATMIARLMMRTTDPRFAGRPDAGHAEALCWEQAAHLIEMEAGLAGVDVGHLRAQVAAATAQLEAAGVTA